MLYRVLRESSWAGVVPWDKSHFFFSDERCVPPEDAGSNRGLAQRELLAHVPVPPAHIHHAPVEADAAEARTAYPAALVRPRGGALWLYSEAGR